MTAPETILNRIRGEFTEMPGLLLTFRQACRLWHLEPVACADALDQLVGESFLCQTRDGSYVALPSSARPIRALSSAGLSRRTA